MASRISGITIEIGGDTTELNKALEKTDKQLKTSKANLRDINKLLKMDPGNTTLLVQKQKNLSDAIKGTKDRLDQLKKAEQDMRGKDLTEEETRQYEALQREIIATEQDLKKLNQQMTEFGSVGAQKIAVLGDKVQQTGQKIKAAGEHISAAGQALLPITAAITAVGAASVAAWKEVDEGGDSIARMTGATGEALAQLQAQAQQLATEIPTDFATASSAIGEIATRFDLQGDALSKLAGEYVRFASVTGQDVAGAVDATQKAMAAWGIATEDAGTYLDALTAAAQKTGVKVGTITQLATTNAAALKELGFTASDAAFFLGQLEKNGVDASGAMAGLKKAYANSLKNGKSLSDQLAELEKGLQNEATRADASATAIELFGARSGAALAEAISTGRLSFDQLGTSLSDFAGTVGSTFDATLDPLDKIQTTLNELKLAGADLVEAAGPLIRDVLEKASAATKKLTGYLKNLTDEQKQTLIKVAAIVAAVGPALIAGGKVVSMVGSLTSGVGKLMKYAPKVVSGLKAAKAGLAAVAGTAGPVIGLVGALAAGLALSIKLHNDHVEAVYGLTDAQKDFNAQLADSAEAYKASEQQRREAISNVDSEIGYYQRLWGELQTLVDENGKVKEGYEARASVIAGILNDALGTEITLTDGAVKNYQNLVPAMDEVIQKKKALAYLEANEGAYKEALTGVTGAQTDYYKAVANTAAAAQEVAEAQSAYDQLMAQSPIVLANAGSVVTEYSDRLLKAKDNLAAMEQAESDAATTYYGFQATISNTEALMEAAESGDGLNEAMMNLANGFLTAETASRTMLENQLAEFEAKYAAMKAAAESGVADVSEADLAAMQQLVDRAKAELEKGGQESGESLASGMESTTDDVQTAGEQLNSAASDGVGNDQYDQGFNRGENWGLGLEAGIASTYNRVKTAAALLAAAIPKTTSAELQIHSPAKPAIQAGVFWGQGLVVGMEDQMRAVAAASSRLAGAMASGNATPMVRFAEQQQAQRAITVTAQAAPSDGAVNRALEIIISRLSNLNVGIRNAGSVMETVTTGVNRRLGRISTLEGSGVI